MTGRQAPGQAVVFAGPSVDRATRRILPAQYRPPVVRGDIDELLRRPVRPRMIGVIDGKFLQSMAISPKEILRALDVGVAVYGSSSMGALRAVECEPWGMIGVGRVFAAYRTGTVDADDEVAMVYDDDDRPLSEPLINLRLALADGIAAGEVEPDHARAFLDAGRRLYFPHRSVRAILRMLREDLADTDVARLADYLTCRGADAKREDARELLFRMRADLSGGLPRRAVVTHDRTGGGPDPAHLVGDQ
ncbi:TfuA-like protein [Solwaraspora sp. WMMB335]|uniref:TfuA-like protein n=1 Tax=Solwaraspora sp. WMMB335 TaxID=3404118 RepID=UPI003B93558D